MAASPFDTSVLHLGEVGDMGFEAWGKPSLWEYSETATLGTMPV